MAAAIWSLRLRPSLVPLLRHEEHAFAVALGGPQLADVDLLLGFVSGDQVLALVFQNEDAPVL